MGKGTVLTSVMVIACLYVFESCNACSEGSNGVVDGILGQSVGLNCTIPESVPCKKLHWQNDTTEPSRGFVSNTNRTSLTMDSGGLVLQIFQTFLYDAGSYSCWCYGEDGRPVKNQSICVDTIGLICQAKVVVNSESKLYNSSQVLSFPSVTVDANVGDKVKVKCFENATTDTDCENAKETDRFTYRFMVSSDHHMCRIECQAKINGSFNCSVSFTLNVSKIETSTQSSISSTTVSTVSAKPTVSTNVLTTIFDGNITHVPANTTRKLFQPEEDVLDKERPGTLPVIIIVGILIAIFVVVTFIICFYIFSSRSKSNSRSNNNKVNSSSDVDIPIGPTYATVDKSSDRCKKGEDDSMKQEVPCTDGFYSEVNDARNMNSTTQQANPSRTETSITYEHYSEVNISNAELDSKEDGAKLNDSNLYSEVEKKQPRQKESSKASSGGSVQSGQTDQVVEQPNSYHSETVGDISTTQVLYAVVDKKKEK